MTVTEAGGKDLREMEPSTPDAPGKSATWQENGDVGWSIGDYFQKLTGLNPKLLDDQWLETLPALPQLPPPLSKATGDQEIIYRLNASSAPH